MTRSRSVKRAQTSSTFQRHKTPQSRLPARALHRGFMKRDRQTRLCKGKSRSRDRATHSSLSLYTLRLFEKGDLGWSPPSPREPSRHFFCFVLPWVSPDSSLSLSQSTRINTCQSSPARQSPLTHMVGCIRAYMRVLRKWPPGRSRLSTCCSSPPFEFRRTTNVSLDK